MGEVLLEFNGPQLMTLKCDDELYLSVASDTDRDKVRWLRARISNTELQALLLGATTVRDCILKSDVLVVDTGNDGTPLAEIAVVADSLGDEDLPGVMSFLPDEMIAANKSIVAKPLFVLNSPSIVAHAIGFRVLADVSQQLQRLWNAIGQTIFGQATAKGSVSASVLSETELRLSSLVPGSVGLSVDVSNDDVFNQVAASYDRLLRSSGDNDSLNSLLHTLKARVRSAFSDYLAVVQKHNVEVLTRWQENAAFVSPSTASRVSSRLEYVGGEEEERFVANGYFVGFHIRDANFEFQDLNDDETKYEGRVAPRVLGQPNLTIIISKSAIYEVEFTLFSWSAAGGPSKQLITLESVKPVGEVI